MPLDFFSHTFQSVVDTGNIAHRIIGQLRRIGQILFHGDLELGPITMKLHGKAPVFAQVEGLLRVGHEQARLDNGHARVLPLREGLSHDGHGKRIVLDRIGLHNG